MRYTYFAFASNMALDQMLQRCPTAEPIGAGRLEGYRMAFFGFSHAWGGAVATVLRARGEYVPGVLYRVTGGDLARLDTFEGVPFVYERRRRRVLDAGGSVRVAHVYSLAHTERPGLPSPEYFRAIHGAYRRQRFDVRPLASALAIKGGASQCPVT